MKRACPWAQCLNKAPEVGVQGIVGRKSSEKPKKTLLEWRVECEEKKNEVLEKQLSQIVAHDEGRSKNIGLHPKTLVNEKQF